MRNVSFHSQRWENIRTQGIHQDNWSFHLYFCHLLHNLHSLQKLYIGETGRRLGNRFREYLRDVEKDDKNASKLVLRHFNLPNHSKQHMAVCGLSLLQGSTESRKTLEQKVIFQIGTLNPHGTNERFNFIKFLLLFFTLPGTNQQRSSNFMYTESTQPTIPRFAPTKD